MTATDTLLACLDGPARLWSGASTQRGYVVPQRVQARIRETVEAETPALVIEIANRRPRSIQDADDPTAFRTFRGVLIGAREADAIRARLGAPERVETAAEPEPAPEPVEEPKAAGGRLAKLKEMGKARKAAKAAAKAQPEEAPEDAPETD
jgi:hypothetical protein